MPFVTISSSPMIALAIDKLNKNKTIKFNNLYFIKYMARILHFLKWRGIAILRLYHWTSSASDVVKQEL